MQINLLYCYRQTNLPKRTSLRKGATLFLQYRIIYGSLRYFTYGFFFNLRAKYARY